MAGTSLHNKEIQYSILVPRPQQGLGVVSARGEWGCPMLATAAQASSNRSTTGHG